MLSCAYKLVTREVMQALRARLPGHLGVEALERYVDEDIYDLREGRLPHSTTLEHHPYDNILHNLIKTIATHPDFERLTSREYDPTGAVSTSSDNESLTDSDDDDYYDDEDEDDSSSESDVQIRRPPFYTKETQFQVINWTPAPW